MSNHLRCRRCDVSRKKSVYDSSLVCNTGWFVSPSSGTRTISIAPRVFVPDLYVIDVVYDPDSLISDAYRLLLALEHLK
jgi:hypothetical protein